MDFFPHGTVFLDPETEKNEELQQIYQKVIKVLPDCKANRDFHPHMTVGKFNKQNVVKKHKELEKEWKEWKIKCEGLHIIRRDKDTPFQT
jgi:2'-5' RNA ligase